MVRPLLCATVFERSLARALEVMALAAARADLVEVRLDPLADPDVEAIVGAAMKPVVLACRRRRDGGDFDGDEESRLDLLRRGIDAGADWVDVEVDAAGRLGAGGATRRIVSHHDPAGTPRDLGAILRRMEDHRADVRKLATLAREPDDVVRVLRLLRESEGPLAAHTMGDAGVPGRILAARLGTAIVYGAARAGAAGAPGQLTLRALVSDYGLARDLDGVAPIVLIGGDLSHSVSPRMMNRTFVAEGIPALYLPWPVADPGPVLRAFGELGLAGVAVTIPLKERVRPHLAELDPPAERVGAVNTIRAGPGGLAGTNTDLGGALDAIRAVLPDLGGRRALVIGAGGAGRAIAHGLAGEGVRVALVDLDRARAVALAGEVGGRAIAISEADPGEVDLVVNASPVGQWPDVASMPVPPGFLRDRHVVMDAVYNPHETALLAAARRAGCRVVPGIEMLAGQGARQLGLWLGVTPPVDRLRAEGVAALDARNLPILLAGMRGAGKTTVGRIVAERLGRDFLDLDLLIEEREGRAIPEIFSTDGEPRFRELERAALETALATQGTVIALGGGALETPACRRAVADRRPRVVYLSAEAAVLAERIRESDRPSLTGAPIAEEVRELLERREPLYREAAGAVVPATGSPDAVADRVLDALGY